MNWLQKCDRDAKRLPAEKRQQFIDCMWQKKMKLGEAAKECGITFDEANGIMRQQIEKHEFHTFKERAVQ